MRQRRDRLSAEQQRLGAASFGAGKRDAERRFG
jgi:hypothetical protein